MKRRLKFLLMRRHMKRLLSPLTRANSTIRSLIGYCHRGGVLVFGTYLIPDSDIKRLGLDRSRLERYQIITKSRHRGYFYPSCSRQDVQLHYPQAIVLYQRARNPLRKIVHLIDTKLLHSSLAMRRRLTDRPDHLPL